MCVVGGGGWGVGGQSVCVCGGGGDDGWIEHRQFIMTRTVHHVLHTHHRKEVRRRRRFHEYDDVDYINGRNEHFNKRIQRAFGQHTKEIKANLERGTALPDR